MWMCYCKFLLIYLFIYYLIKVSIVNNENFTKTVFTKNRACDLPLICQNFEQRLDFASNADFFNIATIANFVVNKLTS